MLKLHLAKGVTKGALTEEQAEAKFQEWVASKANKIDDKKSRLSNEKESKKKSGLEREAKVAKEIAQKVAAKTLPADEVPAEEEARLQKLKL